MQVLPASGAWMALYAGRRLHLRRLHDNATAGVTLLRVLADETTVHAARRRGVLPGPRRRPQHGLYGETRHYVANVMAIKRRLEAGRPPA